MSNLTRIAQTAQDVWFNVIAGQDYAIAIGDMKEGVWDVPVDITYEFAPPNDSFAQASTLPGSPDIYLNGSILSATREPGEPAHGGATNGNSVW